MTTASGPESRINEWSSGAYAIRRMFAERNSRIHGVSLRWIERDGSERKTVRASCNVVRPYW